MRHASDVSEDRSHAFKQAFTVLAVKQLHIPCVAPWERHRQILAGYKPFMLIEFS